MILTAGAVRYRFHTADVFTSRIFGGNPLAVFPDARGLSSERMQQIAREFNLSETVFVLPPELPEHTRRLRIFTPSAELPFAGHPTIGTAHVLASAGEIPITSDVTRIVFEEGAGTVPVAIRSSGGQPTSAQLSAPVRPVFGSHPVSRVELGAVLSLNPSDILEGDVAPQAVSCGVPFLFVPVRDRDALRRIRVDLSRWEELLASSWAPHLYVFAFDPEGEGADLHARSFVPALGIPEDPATGAAAAALAAYLGVRDTMQHGTARWVVEQGFQMGRPSILEVEADKRDGEVIAIRLAGASVLVSEGAMRVPAGR